MTHFMLVSSVTSGDETEKARVKLKRRLKVLGALRDTHVQKDFVEERLAQFPEIEPLYTFLQRRERKLAKGVGATVLALKTRKLEKWMRTACRELACSSDNPPKAGPSAHRVYRSVTDAYLELAKRRERIDPANSDTIHGTRVAFKKFRYMVEALSPLFTGLGKVQLRRLGHYQRRLGNLQDAEVLQALVNQFLQENPERAGSFKPFSRHLAAKRARALQSCLKHLDDVRAFSPIPATERNGRQRYAA